MDEKDEHRHARVAGAYAKTRSLRGALPPRLRRRPAPAGASAAETMSFAGPERAAPQGGRGGEMRSNVARGFGFGFGIGFAAGTALFRVVVFIIAFGALMAALLAALAAVL